MQASERILVALDVSAVSEAAELATALRGHVGGFKIGKELFVSAGPRVIEAVRAEGHGKVFLDLKFHDIPNTVAGAVRAATAHGVWMMNVHAAGGAAMCRAAVRAAVEAAEHAGTACPLIIGVTVLTSLAAADLAAIGFRDGSLETARRLALLAADNGLDGVVASAQEAAAIKEACGPEFLVVCPGIRPAGGETDDQQRIMTPAKAVRAGADYLVIGRPITQSPDPAAAAAAIAAEIEDAQRG